MKNISKPSILLPILAGILTGTLLFILGAMDDAPGLSLIGLIAAFLLIMQCIYNASIITKGFLSPILTLCFGLGGVLFSVMLLFDGEFGDAPYMALIGVAIGLILIALDEKKLHNTMHQ